MESFLVSNNKIRPLISQKETSWLPTIATLLMTRLTASERQAGLRMRTLQLRCGFSIQTPTLIFKFNQMPSCQSTQVISNLSFTRAGLPRPEKLSSPLSESSLCTILSSTTVLFWPLREATWPLSRAKFSNVRQGISNFKVSLLCSKGLTAWIGASMT